MVKCVVLNCIICVSLPVRRLELKKRELLQRRLDSLKRNKRGEKRYEEEDKKESVWGLEIPVLEISTFPRNILVHLRGLDEESVRKAKISSLKPRRWTRPLR